MRQMSPTNESPDIETSSDDYASRFGGRAGAYFLKRQSQSVDDLLKGAKMLSVLDVGGGHGQLIPLFIEHRYDLTVLGSDDSCGDRIREGFSDSDVKFITGNLLSLPFPNQSFDLVVSVRLISHIENPEILIREFCRVAKHSIIIDYPSWYSLNALTPLLFYLKKGIEGNTRTYTSFRKQKLAEKFQKYGFQIERSNKQFLLPMFIHRVLKGARWLQVVENAFAWTRLTSLIGSPVIIRADRKTGWETKTL